MKKYSTPQEEFWAGEFGDEYIGRNYSEGAPASGVAFWARILRSVRSVNSICELGANIGLIADCKIEGKDIYYMHESIFKRISRKSDKSNRTRRDAFIDSRTFGGGF